MSERSRQWYRLRTNVLGSRGYGYESLPLEYSDDSDTSCASSISTSTTRRDNDETLTTPPMVAAANGVSWRRRLGVAILIGVELCVLFSIYQYQKVRLQVLRATVSSRDYAASPFEVIDDWEKNQSSRFQFNVAMDRSMLFWDLLREGQVPDHDLNITQHDINSLFAMSEYLRGHAYVWIAEDKLILEYALPMVGVPGGRLRYLMGEIILRTSSSDSASMDIRVVPNEPIGDAGLIVSLVYRQLLTHFQQQEVRYFREWGPVVLGMLGDWILRGSNATAFDAEHVCYDGEVHIADPIRKNTAHLEQQCEDIMNVLARMSVSFQDGQIVVSPRRGN